MGVKKEIGKRSITIIAVVVIAVYSVVLISNFGGEMDRVIKSGIKTRVSQELMRNPNFSNLPEEKQEEMIEKRVKKRIKVRGLDEPFFQRSIRYWIEALKLDLGRAMYIRSAAGSSKVRDIIMERLPRTVMLFTTATVISAILGVYVGLNLARKALSKFDRVLTFFSAFTRVIPSWVFGIIFILFFAFLLPVFPSGGYTSTPPPEGFSYYMDVLYHMSLPLITLIVANFGYWAYISRNLLVETMQEDFVSTALAKGIPSGKLLRRHVLRPSLPPILTAIILSVIASWMGAILTEIVFNWPGLGLLFWNALQNLDTPIIIGTITVYAYLLGATVLIIDVLYRYIDPRIRTMGR